MTSFLSVVAKRTSRHGESSRFYTPPMRPVNKKLERSVSAGHMDESKSEK
jgi:hypothetical protein